MLATGTATAQVHSWTDWTSESLGAPGSAGGTLTSVQGLASVTVGYSGHLSGAQTAGGGTNFWNPAAPYTSATVSNAPPPTDILQLSFGSASLTQTITFSSPLTNPKMAIMSLGAVGAPTVWTFDRPFTILSQGTGFFGPGTLTSGIGNALTGSEGHGTIQFNGTFSSISWTATNPENFSGFTIGAPTTVLTGAPEPGTLALLSLGIVGGIIARRRHAK